MADLSPAAQAILTVYGRATGDISCVWHPSELKGLAAVLHELADHVAPVRAWHESTNDMAWERHQMTVIINNRILAIAAELEATTP